MTKTTCRDVAVVLADTGTLGMAYTAPVARHLSQCPKCVAFERQLVLVNEAVKHDSQAYEEELPHDFETRLVQRLC